MKHLLGFTRAVIALTIGLLMTNSVFAQTEPKPDIMFDGTGITIGGDPQGNGGLKVQWRGEVELSCQDAVPVNGQYMFNISYTMKNSGPVPANPIFTNKIFSDASMIANQPGQMLNPNESKVVSIQAPLSVGMHALKINLDDGNVVTEGQEFNNSVTINYNLTCGGVPAPPNRLKLTARLADITAGRGITIGGKTPGTGTFVAWGGSIKLSKNDAFLESNGQFAFNLTYDMTNAGAISTGPFDNKVLSDANIVGQQTGQTLNASETKQINTQAYLPVGRHTLTLRLDANSAVAESNESNNTFTITFILEP